MSSTDAFNKRDEMIDIINNLVAQGAINVNSIRKNTMGTDYTEDDYPSLVIDIVNSETIRSASIYSEIYTTYSFILMDYLDDMQDDEEIDNKKKSMHVDVKTITDAVIGSGEVVSDTEFAEIIDGSNVVTAIAWTIKK